MASGNDAARWLSTRHALRVEAAAVLGLYGVYELARGLVVGDARDADHHARQVVAVERWLHLFLEANVQHAARSLPGFTNLLGAAYLTLHLGVTAGVLVWLHQRRPAAFGDKSCITSGSSLTLGTRPRPLSGSWKVAGG